MNQQIWSGLATVLLITTAGTSPSRADQDKSIEPVSKTNVNLEASPIPSSATSPKITAQKTRSKARPRSLRRSGTASWYGPGFHGRRTASGERFNSYGLTAAHRSLPFGTRVRVTNARTGRSVVVRINDRGPFSRGRVIDLSRGAARVLGVTGTAPVRLDVLR